ncbi:MAG: restriction endonuclease [Leptolyngbya foveolarum]|uniref:Restriction endonuclease n=1 Tax=Leptolyngbya foveolarum TaxID=47253 RepID=A0A2W4TLZ5_9CYAN|nr:MAG: restriction endonuclease [Leptolyngbya foveolarum]
MNSLSSNNATCQKDFPKDWKQARLRYVARLAYGDSLTASQREPGDVPVFGSNGIVGLHKLANTLAPLIVVGRKGSFGKITYSEDRGFVIDTAYFIDSSCAKANLRWLYYALQVLGLDEISQDTGVPGLSREKAYECRLLLPTIKDQEAIAHFLDRKTAAIATLIAKKQRLIQLLEEKRTALINQAVTKGLNPDAPMKDSGVPWIGEIPEHWESNVKLRYLTRKERGSFVNGPFGSDLLVSELKPEGIPVIYIRDIKPYGYRRKSIVCVSQEKANQLNLFRVDPGDVIIAKVGDPPGDSCIYPESEPPGIVTQDVIRLKLKTQYNSEYISFMMNSGLGTNLIGMISIASTRERVSLGDFKSLRVVCPPITEQQRITSFLNSETQYIDNLTSKTLASVEKLQEYRRSLITAAVTGKLDIPKAEANV